MATNLPLSGVSMVAQNAGQFISQMNSADKALGTFGKGAGAMSNIVTGAFRQVGAIITNVLANAVRAVGQWVGESLSVAGDFSETLSVMGATSGATAAQLDQVAAKAKELGADLELPTTSANDAAEVMLELSKAGLDVQESMDAAKGALLLAAAADTDAATATGILTGALNAFGLEATEATRIADLLAAGANASSASMTDLGAGLQQAGAIAHTAGVPVEDLITSLAALTNVGYTGSDAGTALKNALVRLIDPTDKAAAVMADLGFKAYDSQGKMKPLPILIRDLNASLAGMTDEQRNAALSNIFLSDGMKAMIPLLALGEDGFLALKEQVTEEGAAADVARARMQGWNGALASAKSQLENLQLTVGQFLTAALTPMLFSLGETIAKITAFADAMFASGDPAAFLTAKINEVLPGFTKMMDAIGLVAQALGAELPSSAQIASGVLTAIRDVLVGVVIPAITVAATWLAANLPAAIAQAKAAFADIHAFIQAVMPTIQSIISTALAIIATYWEQNGSTILTRVQGVYEMIKGAIQIVLGAIQGILAIALGIMTGDWDTALATIRDANTTIWNGISQFLSGILRIIASFFGMTLDEMLAKWASVWNEISTTATNIWNAIVSTVTTQANAIASTVANVIAGVVSTWNSLFGELLSTVDSVMSSAASIVESTLGSISGAFRGIIGAVNDAIAAVKRFISAVAGIEVPDLINPGSPTPLELGIRGIDKAAKSAARTFQAQFAPAIGSVPAMQSAQVAGNTTNTSYGPSYSMPIYTNQSPAVLSQGLALVAAVSR